MTHILQLQRSDKGSAKNSKLQKKKKKKTISGQAPLPNTPYASEIFSPNVISRSFPCILPHCNHSANDSGFLCLKLCVTLDNFLTCFKCLVCWKDILLFFFSSLDVNNFIKKGIELEGNRNGEIR